MSDTFGYKHCLNCEEIIFHKNRRDIKRKKYCSRKCLGEYVGKRRYEENKEFYENLIKLCNSKESNKKKGHPGSSHPKWIIDRTKLKTKRCIYEEKEFFKKILKDRNYICELTGETGGKLSVHHIDSVHLFPKKRFDEDNVIVIKKDFHLDFHKKFGFQWATREKWNKYLKEFSNACTQ